MSAARRMCARGSRADASAVTRMRCVPPRRQPSSTRAVARVAFARAFAAPLNIRRQGVLLLIHHRHRLMPPLTPGVSLERRFARCNVVEGSP